MSDVTQITVVFPPAQIASVVIHNGLKGDEGAPGKGTYQSYLDTTADDPVMTEAQWIAATVSVSEPVEGDFIQRGPTGWIRRTIDQIKTALGLGSAAYTASENYAAALHGHNYLPLAGGTMDANAAITFANGTRIVQGQMAGAPGATDDATKGFSVDSLIMTDAGDFYVCLDATENSALWGKVLTFTGVNNSGSPELGAYHGINVGPASLRLFTGVAYARIIGSTLVATDDTVSLDWGLRALTNADESTSLVWDIEDALVPGQFGISFLTAFDLLRVKSILPDARQLIAPDGVTVAFDWTVATCSGNNTGDETAESIAAIVNASTEISILADGDKIGGTDASAEGLLGWFYASTLWTWIKAKIDTGQTWAGDHAFTGQLTASNQAASGSTSLMTRQLTEESALNSMYAVRKSRYAVFTANGGTADANNDADRLVPGTGANARPVVTRFQHLSRMGSGQQQNVRPMSIATFGAIITQDGVMKARCGIGMPLQAAIPAADQNALAGKGFGWEMYNTGSTTKLRLFAHDGTSYVTSSELDTGLNTNTSYDPFFYIVLSLAADGTVSARTAFGDNPTSLRPSASATLTLAGGPTSGNFATSGVQWAALNPSGAGSWSGSNTLRIYDSAVKTS